MNKQQWQRLSLLWDRVASARPEQRNQLLEDLQEEDPALHQHLEALLEHAQDDTFLADPVLVEHPIFAESIPQPDPWLGRTLGPYTLAERIGEGGMGLVYRGERRGESFQQQVAIKVLHGPFGHRRLHQRLVAERRILAQLDHPHIARLLDGASTKEGVPYVVMEYVAGVTLSVYLKQASPELRSRLELFRKICDAVHYAHRHLVVHRDLKPANILVTEDGEPKLLDFGIAKLLTAEAKGEELPTRTLARALTPSYASPEQVAGRPVTTAADIYSLGVLLYELLCGQRPFDLSSQSPAEAQRLLENQSPPLPSELEFKKRNVWNVPAAQSATPETKADGLSESKAPQRPVAARTLRGDLDNITLRALEAEPERRYPSAEALSQDIDRYLSGLPVSARPQTFGYRFTKLVKRNRSAAVLVALLALSTLALALVSTLQADRLRQERNTARAETERAEEAVEFLEKMFSVSIPESEAGPEISVRELLDRHRNRVLTDLADRPHLQARLLGTLGNIYLSLGSYDQTQELLDLSLLRYSELPGDHRLEMAQTRTELGLLLNQKGQPAQAIKVLQEALRGIRAQNRPDPNDLVNVHRQLGFAYRDRGSFEEAEKNFREALHLLSPQEKEIQGQLLTSLGTVVGLRGDLARASLLGSRGLEMLRASDAIPLTLAGALASQAENLRNLNQFSRARSMLEEAVEIFRRYDVNPVREGAALNNLAATLRAQGDLQGAAKAYGDSLELLGREPGPKNLRVATIMSNLAKAHGALGNFPEAQTLMNSALRTFPKTDSPHHPYLGIVHHIHGEIYRDQELLEQALEASDKAIEILSRLGNEAHPWMAAAQSSRGSILLALGDLDEAESLIRQSLTSQQQSLGTEAPRVAASHHLLARLFWRQGRKPSAFEEFQEALRIYRLKLPDQHPDIGACLVDLGEARLENQEVESALAALAQGLEILRFRLPENHWRVEEGVSLQRRALASRQ
ncbi:MAG: serine/threonine-protein kinase [Deltaproteobacteria bacterium]|nr:serine/threonine-protein kinase [Deltaproteobacteria bacterium]